MAVAKLPASWKPLVVDAVSTYFHLNISDQLNLYNGPILVIRRTMDEIINTNEEEPIKTNRSNDIIIKLFKNRFPNLMKDEAVDRALIGWLTRDISCNYQFFYSLLLIINNLLFFKFKNSLSLST